MAGSSSSWPSAKASDSTTSAPPSRSAKTSARSSAPSKKPTPADQRPPRWSKRTDALVVHVATGAPPGLQSELGAWLEANPRFAAFVAAHQDKIRKKLATADGPEARLDVRAELLVAQRLLEDRRLEVAFETYGVGKVGPDLSVTYRVTQRCNLEVTRLRSAASPPRLAQVIAAKVRQLPQDAPNALVVVVPDMVTEAVPADALRLLKTRSTARDDAFFRERGYADAPTFAARQPRLSGVFVLAPASPPPRVSFLANPEARRPVPPEALVRLQACLAAD